MDLKTFVKEALSQIDSALEETTQASKKYTYSYGNNISGNATIDFEVQVYAGDSGGASGGLGINVAGINIGTKGEIISKNHEQSTIKFNVLRQNTPEQEIKERSKWNNTMNHTSFSDYEDNQTL